MTVWLLQRLWLLAAFAALPLPFLSPEPALSVGVWGVVVLAWYANRRAINAAESNMLVSALLPAILLGQYLVDRVACPIGSILVLVAWMESIGKVVRASNLSEAWVHRL